MIQLARTLVPAIEFRHDDGDVDAKLAENPHNPLTAVFMEGGDAHSGARITEETALTLTTVWRAVSLISGAVAKIPLITYRRTKDGRERAEGHYLERLLQGQTSDRMTSFRFKRLMQTWLLLWGNAYAEIVQSDRGQIVQLLPWRPDRVSIDGEYYVYTMADGTRVALHANNVLHLRGLETDGVVGLSPIRAARRTLGLSASAEEYGSRYFVNNGRPGGWIEHPNQLSDKTLKRIRADYESIHRGLKGAHRIAILEEGMKYHDVGLPPEDMQFIESRKLGGEDVARIFGAPPHKLGIMDKATFSNIEHQSIEFVTDCLGDWFGLWESEIMLMLLSEREQKTIYVEFLPDALLKGDIVTRYRAYAIGRQNSFLNPNEIRAMENRNSIEGGDVYLQPLNMGELGAEAPPPADPTGDPGGDPGNPAGGEGTAEPEPPPAPATKKKKPAVKKPAAPKE